MKRIILFVIKYFAWLQTRQTAIYRARRRRWGEIATGEKCDKVVGWPSKRRVSRVDALYDWCTLNLTAHNTLLKSVIQVGSAEKEFPQGVAFII